MQFKGEVAYLDSKQLKSRKTGKSFTVYSMKLRTDDGELTPPLDCGFDRPAIDKGDYVEVTTEQNAGGYEKVTAVAEAARPAQKRSPSPAPAGEQPAQQDGTADRQTQIVLQHSQEMAIAEAGLLLKHDALPLTAANSKAGQAKRYSEIHEIVRKLTVELYNDVISARLLEKVADAGAVEVAADGEIPPAKAPVTAEDDD